MHMDSHCGFYFKQMNKHVKKYFRPTSNTKMIIKINEVNPKISMLTMRCSFKNLCYQEYILFR